LYLPNLLLTTAMNHRKNPQSLLNAATALDHHSEEFF